MMPYGQIYINSWYRLSYRGPIFYFVLTNGGETLHMHEVQFLLGKVHATILALRATSYMDTLAHSLTQMYIHQPRDFPASAFFLAHMRNP